MKEELRTRELFEAGYAMTRGLVLHEVNVSSRNGRHPVATFVFVGDAAQAVAEEYRTGQAEANVRLLSDAVGFLRKRLFAAIDERDGR